MRYLIDGYNLFFRVWQEIFPFQKELESFLKDLDHEIDALGLESVLVLDSCRDVAEVFPSSKKLQALNVLFSPRGLCADAYILELLSWKSCLTTLVTSDKELALKARRLGAQIQSSEEFVAMLIKNHRKRGEGERDKTTSRESTENFFRLLKIFKGRASRDENA